MKPKYLQDIDDYFKDFKIHIMERQRIKLLNIQGDDYTCGYYLIAYFEKLLLESPEKWINFIEADNIHGFTLPVKELESLKRFCLVLATRAHEKVYGDLKQVFYHPPLNLEEIEESLFKKGKSQVEAINLI